MTSPNALATQGKVTAAIDPTTDEIEASAVFDTTPERLFRALTSKEICNWWVLPGVFNTQEWSGAEMFAKAAVGPLRGSAADSPTNSKASSFL